MSPITDSDQHNLSRGRRTRAKAHDLQHAPKEVEEAKHLDDDAKEGIFEEDEDDSGRKGDACGKRTGSTWLVGSRTDFSSSSTRRTRPSLGHASVPEEEQDSLPRSFCLREKKYIVFLSPIISGSPLTNKICAPPNTAARQLCPEDPGCARAGVRAGGRRTFPNAISGPSNSITTPRNMKNAPNDVSPTCVLCVPGTESMARRLRSAERAMWRTGRESAGVSSCRVLGLSSHGEGATPGPHGSLNASIHPPRVRGERAYADFCAARRRRRQR